MQLRRISTFFTAAGVVMGAVAVLGYAFDLVPELPPAALKLVIYKLTFIGALGLVAFGALLGRLARQKGAAPAERVEPVESPDLLPEPLPPLNDRKAASERRPEQPSRNLED